MDDYDICVLGRPYHKLAVRSSEIEIDQRVAVMQHDTNCHLKNENYFSLNGGDLKARRKDVDSKKQIVIN